MSNLVVKYKPGTTTIEREWEFVNAVSKLVDTFAH